VRAPPLAAEIMETRASYTLVGTFVLILMLALAGFVIWLAKFSSDVKYDEYNILFSGSVTGLSSDATVRYRGIPVGHVTNIEISPNDIDKIMITIQVDATTPVRTDTVASIEMQGITGVAYVQLTGGSETAPPLEPDPGESIAYITAENSALQEVFKSAPDMINSAIELMNRGSDMLSDDNRAAVTSILANISTITGELADNKDAIGALITDAQATLANVQGTTADIKQVTTELSENIGGLMDDASKTLETLRTTLQTADTTIANAEPNIQATLADLRAAAASIKGAAAAAQNILQGNEAPINEFAQNGLYEFTQFIVDARSLVASLTQIAVQLERDPAAFLFGGNQSGYQAQ
jgi:phospholipid/cholesterol/gamma-HCH transport system substrate-binding protein